MFSTWEMIKSAGGKLYDKVASECFLVTEETSMGKIVNNFKLCRFPFFQVIHSTKHNLYTNLLDLRSQYFNRFGQRWSTKIVGKCSKPHPTLAAPAAVIREINDETEYRVALINPPPPPSGNVVVSASALYRRRAFLESPYPTCVTQPPTQTDFNWLSPVLLKTQELRGIENRWTRRSKSSWLLGNACAERLDVIQSQTIDFSLSLSRCCEQWEDLSELAWFFFSPPRRCIGAYRSRQLNSLFEPRLYEFERVTSPFFMKYGGISGTIKFPSLLL